MTILGQDDEIRVVVRLVAKTLGRNDEHEPGEHACGNLIDDALWKVDVIENALGPFHFDPVLHALVSRLQGPCPSDDILCDPAHTRGLYLVILRFN